MTDWDERYRQDSHASEERHPVIIEFAAKLAPGRALDIACGSGRHAIWLAERGWEVTAVDYSQTAIEILLKRSSERGVTVNSCTADLARHEFTIERESFDLIVNCNYLQRDLFPSIRAGTRVGGVVMAIIAMVDDDPKIKPMNPDYLLTPGELRAQFQGWKLIHDFEGKRSGDSPRRATAEIVARRTL